MCDGSGDFKLGISDLKPEHSDALADKVCASNVESSLRSDFSTAPDLKASARAFGLAGTPWIASQE